MRPIFKYLWVVTLRLFFPCDFKISVAALGVASVQESSNRAIQKKDVPRISLMAAATVSGTSLYLLIFKSPSPHCSVQWCRQKSTTLLYWTILYWTKMCDGTFLLDSLIRVILSAGASIVTYFNNNFCETFLHF